MVDGHCSSHKPINSSVPQGSVLSPTLFLLFISDLSVTNCPTHSYADDSTLHYSTSFDRRPTLQDLEDSRLEAAEHLTSDLALISDWDRRNLVSFNASKTQFLHLLTRHNLSNSYPLFFDNTQLSPSSTLNILGLSFTQNFNWKFTSVLTKSASSKLGVLYRLCQFLSPAQLMSIYRGLVRPRMAYASHVWGGSTHTALLVYLLLLFSLWLLFLLTACLPPSCGLAAPAFAHMLIPLLSKSRMLELTSNLNSFTGKLWNDLPKFICICSCLWLELSQEESVRTYLLLNLVSLLAFIGAASSGLFFFFPLEVFMGYVVQR